MLTTLDGELSIFQLGKNGRPAILLVRCGESDQYMEGIDHPLNPTKFRFAFLDELPNEYKNGNRGVWRSRNMSTVLMNNLLRDRREDLIAARSRRPERPGTFSSSRPKIRQNSNTNPAKGSGGEQVND